MWRRAIWNVFDNFGLLVGIERKPNESNLDYHIRLIAEKKYNSTKQGIVNWLSDSFAADKYNVDSKYIFYSLFPPLTEHSYNKIKDPEIDYYAPRVIADGIEYIITAGNDEEVDTGTVGSISWNLYKNSDYSWNSIWITDSSPTDIILRYQIYDEGGDLKVIEEKPKRLTWDSGIVVEEDLDEETS